MLSELRHDRTRVMGWKHPILVSEQQKTTPAPENSRARVRVILLLGGRFVVSLLIFTHLQTLLDFDGLWMYFASVKFEVLKRKQNLLLDLKFPSVS